MTLSRERERAACVTYWPALFGILNRDLLTFRVLLFRVDDMSERESLIMVRLSSSPAKECHRQKNLIFPFVEDSSRVTEGCPRLVDKAVV